MLSQRHKVLLEEEACIQLTDAILENGGKEIREAAAVAFRVYVGCIFEARKQVVVVEKLGDFFFFFFGGVEKTDSYSKVQLILDLSKPQTSNLKFVR